MSSPIEITVYDYRAGDDAVPTKRVVKAWIAADFKAFFIEDGILYEVAGDDGHWWIDGQMDAGWLEHLQETVASITLSKKDKRAIKKGQR